MTWELSEEAFLALVFSSETSSTTDEDKWLEPCHSCSVSLPPYAHLSDTSSTTDKYQWLARVSTDALYRLSPNLRNPSASSYQRNSATWIAYLDGLHMTPVKMSHGWLDLTISDLGSGFPLGELEYSNVFFIPKGNEDHGLTKRINAPHRLCTMGTSFIVACSCVRSGVMHGSALYWGRK